MDMAEDCVRHARMFFNRPDLDLTSSIPGSFALTPHDRMLTDLRRDYQAMSGMCSARFPAWMRWSRPSQSWSSV
jgi:hypothetical protein